MRRHHPILILLLTLIGVLSGPTTEAQILRSKRAVARERQEQRMQEQSKSPYERFFTTDTTSMRSAQGPFLSLHLKEKQLYMELPSESFGEEMLIAATVSDISNPQLGLPGFKNSGPIPIRFIQKDSVVVMEVVNNDLLYDPTDKSALVKNIRKSYTNVSLHKFPITGLSSDGKSVLFDVTDFFLNEQRFFDALVSEVGSYRLSSSPRPDLSSFTSVKSFETNATVGVERTSYVTLTNSRGKGLEDYPTTYSVTYSLLRLPAVPMTPRLSDTRVNFFLTEKDILRSDNHQIETVNFIRRWRLEPVDMEALKRGELTEVKKPIVYYVDDNFPERWRAGIKAGVLRWNKAFERIGLKDVVQVKDFPKDDPEFDPDNLKYSCIRYVPVGIENAMGPSWYDPRTGEIINASVMVYSNVIKTLNNWRFVQTAQLDPAVRSKVLSDSLLTESLEYVIAHEVGHTLGLMHNMAASAAYSVDSLRSPSFTHKYGTTPSIMDYARWNYVAQREDKGVSLDPPYLGAFDYYAIEWGYKVFPELEDNFFAESKELQKYVSRHEGNPIYRYGVQQVESRLDPTAIEEDLSDDPIRAGELGMRNLMYITEHLDEWITDDPGAEHRGELYEQILAQAYGYYHNIFMLVPGIILRQTSESSGIPRHQVLPKERQREAALWLIEHAEDFRKLGLEKLVGHIPYASLRPFDLVQQDLLKMTMLNTGKLAISYYFDSDSYSPMEYLEDVYSHIFGPTLRGASHLSETEIALQEAFVRYLNASLQYGLQNVYPVGLKSDALSLSYKADKTVCNHAGEENGLLGFGNGNGFPEHLWAQTVNMTSDYTLSYALKVRDLLKRTIPRTRDANLRAHYRLLLGRLDKSLDK